jgi:hypothetical protein
LGTANAWHVFRNCATYNNTSGAIDGTENTDYDQSGNVALSADPFVSGTDFRAHNTNGAALIGAAFVVPGQTDYGGDIGALQCSPTLPTVGNVIKDVQYGANGTALTGTFDEAARNTDPGEENVEDGVTYKILNVAKEGTMVGGGGAVIGGGAAVFGQIGAW